MNPTAIPVAMLYESGIVINVKNAGIATSSFFQSISPIEDTINTPTIINAGAVTGAVTTLNNGEKNSDSKNKIPVTTAEKPASAVTLSPPVKPGNAIKSARGAHVYTRPHARPAVLFAAHTLLEEVQVLFLRLDHALAINAIDLVGVM